FGYDFKIDRRALIPRFDTEILVEEALRRIHPGMRILDICTGSGCVPIAVAKTLEEQGRHQKEEPQTPGTAFDGTNRSKGADWAQKGEAAFANKERLERDDQGGASILIEASDISEDALALARENAKRLGASVHFFQSDLLLSAEGRYNLITANPPYITEGEMRSLDQEVRDYEPHLALFGGADGLDFYRRLVKEAPGHLAPGGWLLMEIGCSQAKAVEALCFGEGFTEIKTVQDLAGRDRVVTARRRN
ncbi:MAG: peptide chain release factor N(5)-glutamine methyltransferase, partial [bacterium]